MDYEHRPKLSSQKEIIDYILDLNKSVKKLFTRIQNTPPAGSLMTYAGTTLPDGYLNCDGSVYNISDFPDLFDAISNVYGGNGTTTFGIPNVSGGVFLRGVVTAAGSTGGAASHSHPLSSAGSASMYATGTTQYHDRVTRGFSYSATFPIGVGNANTGNVSISTPLLGNTDSASSLPPYLNVRVGIKF